MVRYPFHLLMFALAGIALIAAPVRADRNEDYEKATKAAIKKVAPCVVQIVTQGGTDLVVTGAKGAKFRKALGPTTGVIVSNDGYIISSAFNFINNPTSILVEISGQEKRFLAKRIATDKSRMLTLLKIDGKGLPVPDYVPKKQVFVGQWALALGRTLDTDQNNPPSLHMGIISALGRVWGKCIQTDANTSPVNYGGPLIDIQGRVQGIIIPASPRGTGETAGFEWYDSGIGFAIPMEDVIKQVVPRLKKGKDVKKGLLGVRMRSGDLYGAKPVIGSVLPNTAAARVGLKAGDEIIELEGKPVIRMAQIKHILGTKYEGDKISLKYKRSGKVVAINDLELVGKLTAFANAFMGILPMRDNPKAEVEIRHIYSKSPAEKAGLKIGDRVVKYGKGKVLRKFKGKKDARLELEEFLNGQQPGTEIKLQVARKGGNKTETVQVKLTSFPGASAGQKDAPPKESPKVASRKKALEVPGAPKLDKKAKVETGLLKHTAAGGNQQYWIYIHEDYDPNVAHALLVWLHPPKKNKEQDIDTLATTWDEYCNKHNIIIVAPKTDSVNGWTPSDSRRIREVIRDVLGKYSIDKQRVIAHGMGIGGQMAIYLGFHARDLIRGVATSGAVPTGIKDNVPTRRLAFFLVTGDRDPVAKAIAKSQSKLTGHRLPVIYRELKGVGRQYMDDDTLGELARWIDALDRQ